MDELPPLSELARSIHALHELCSRKQWVVWRYVERNGQYTKVPFNALSGREARSNEPRTWASYAQALDAYRRSQGSEQPYEGTGFMFRGDYTGIDLDHCIDAQGEVEPWARAIVERLDSYTEISPSGQGLHIYIGLPIPRGLRRSIPPHMHPSHPKAAIEMYSQGRYFTITGRHLAGTPEGINGKQEVMDALFNEVKQFKQPSSPRPPRNSPASHTTKGTPQDGIATPAPSGRTSLDSCHVSLDHRPGGNDRDALQLPAQNSTRPAAPTGGQPDSDDSCRTLDSDASLIEQAFNAANGEKFRRLYQDGNLFGYISASEADLALCILLAFWTGKDAQRIDRIFRTSALYRLKWDARRGEQTYGEATIQMALTYCTTTYQPQMTTGGQAEALTQLQALLEHRTQRLVHNYRLQAKPLELKTVLEHLEQNELGDARLFVAAFGDQLCYDHTEKAWYFWEEHYWKRDRINEVLVLISDALGEIYLDAHRQLSDHQEGLQERIMLKEGHRFYKENEQEGAALFHLKSQVNKLQKVKLALQKRANGLRTLNRSMSVLHYVQAELGVVSDVWDHDPWLLATPSGVLDLRTGQLRPGRPEDFIRTVCPTKWTGLETPCPRFEQFLQEIFEDKPDRTSVIAFLQRLFGYSITGLTCEAVFPILFGEEGRNGKDTLLNVLREVLGPHAGAVSHDVFTSSDRFRSGGAPTPHLCDLQGKRLIWGNETRQGECLNVAQIKWLTGGSEISARQLHGEQFSFQPTHLMLLMTNYKPQADARDKAFWERACLIDFKMRFVDRPKETYERKKDSTLLGRLKAERSGILAWLVRGCLRWQQVGLNTPSSVLLWTERYREEEDNLLAFIGDCCIVRPDAEVRASELYNAYKEWGKENQLVVLNGRLFKEEMSKRFAWKRNNKGKYYSGIKLSSCSTLDTDDDSYTFDDSIEEMVPPVASGGTQGDTASQAVSGHGSAVSAVHTQVFSDCQIGDSTVEGLSISCQNPALPAPIGNVDGDEMALEADLSLAENQECGDFDPALSEQENGAEEASQAGLAPVPLAEAARHLAALSEDEREATIVKQNVEREETIPLQEDAVTIKLETSSEPLERQSQRYSDPNWPPKGFVTRINDDTDMISALIEAGDYDLLSNPYDVEIDENAPYELLDYYCDLMRVCTSSGPGWLVYIGPGTLGVRLDHASHVVSIFTPDEVTPLLDD
ncbi:hypothetical protein EPA93_27555 [Ktedonosporobacter rubrisoli]|uniref:SF3 helicase domain-containing protein n=1 Tax=Ktedonosporobacter rubrisoli TaxID=2509675 RepID=A0A4P6JVW9_KTERU|nr:phage/plasmid primase, P4 family [Ktedonosporobacter rubrisoli]QBD79533.1 hypothetical protein EPA93_27555 [Ktedonosporobacter rubrisoli]